MRGSFSDSRSRDSRGQRDYMQRDPGGQDQSRPLLPPPPPPPPRAIARAAQDAAAGNGRRRDRPRGAGNYSPRKQDSNGVRKCFSCGQAGHVKRNCPTQKQSSDGDGKMTAQAHVAVPYPPTPVPSVRDQGSESDYKMAERVKELELWRENLNQTRKRRSDHPTELERATKVVLSSLGREKPFDPFE